jgi:hypothetical protein
MICLDKAGNQPHAHDIEISLIFSLNVPFPPHLILRFQSLYCGCCDVISELHDYVVSLLDAVRHHCHMILIGFLFIIASHYSHVHVPLSTFPLFNQILVSCTILHLSLYGYALDLSFNVTYENMT